MILAQSYLIFTDGFCGYLCNLVCLVSRNMDLRDASASKNIARIAKLPYGQRKALWKEMLYCREVPNCPNVSVLYKLSELSVLSALSTLCIVWIVCIVCIVRFICIVRSVFIITIVCVVLYCLLIEIWSNL